MGAFEKAFQSRTHRERSQLETRKKLGLLEKKKDYALRAKDYHGKQDRLKAMKAKASTKNPDEFYYGMYKSKISKGKHVRKDSESKSLPSDVVHLLKSQDIGYVNKVVRENQKKLDRLNADVSLSNINIDIDSRGIQTSSQFAKRISFDEEGNSIVLETVSNSSMAKTDPKVVIELRERNKRVEQLLLANNQLRLQKELLGKGRKRKFGLDDHGQPIYRWAQERKR